MPSTSRADVIIVAAGSGTRFGAAKQFARLHGMPLYHHCLRVFSGHPDIGHIVLVIPADDINRIEEEIWQFGKKIEISLGGATRQDSVSNGLQKLDDLGSSEIVLVHDAARPFTSAELISNVIAGIEKYGAALAAIPVVDTIKESAEGFSVSTIPRSKLWRAQTPQGARYDLLKKALEAAHRDNYTASDDAELLERIGIRPLLVPGEETNVKITYEKDLRNFESAAGR